MSCIYEIRVTARPKTSVLDYCTPDYAYISDGDWGDSRATEYFYVVDDDVDVYDIARRINYWRVFIEDLSDRSFYNNIEIDGSIVIYNIE